MASEGSDLLDGRALIPVEDSADPRIAAFRDVKERDLTGRQGLFVAEGEVVLRVLASGASRCAPAATPNS